MLRPGGILRWSTLCVLAGGAGLSSCGRNEPPAEVATERDAEMARTQQQIEELDAGRDQLLKGEVPNNFELKGLGYYHAGAHDFFAQSYNTMKDGQWFVDGTWQDHAGPAFVAASRPNAEALKKVDQALEKEQELLAQEKGSPATGTAGTGTGSGNGSGTTVNHYHHSSGMGTALMMYWLLSGNRGGFSPGAGFQHAAAQAPAWQGEVERQRTAVSSHAAAHPAYQRMVAESKARGVPVRAGQSVRGGFGSSHESHASGGGGGGTSGRSGSGSSSSHAGGGDSGGGHSSGGSHSSGS